MNTALEEAREALRKRQAAADEALRIDRERADDLVHAAIASVDYVNATAELADQWLRLAAIEAGHNPLPTPARHSTGFMPAPKRGTAATPVRTNA